MIVGARAGTLARAHVPGVVYCGPDGKDCR
jgi:hypothetical protein